jgi:hypothetical protein
MRVMHAGGGFATASPLSSDAVMVWSTLVTVMSMTVGSTAALICARLVEACSSSLTRMAARSKTLSVARPARPHGPALSRIRALAQTCSRRCQPRP